MVITNMLKLFLVLLEVPLPWPDLAVVPNESAS